MRSKYRNKSCRCISGHIHDSRGEARYCDTLYFLKKGKEIKDYRIQVKYSLDVNGKHIANHYVDFEVELPDGKIQVEEFKGFATREWSIKKKLFEAIYPDIKYVVIRA